MRCFTGQFLAALALFLGSVVIAQEPTSTPARTPRQTVKRSATTVQATKAAAAPGFTLVGSIKEIMQGIVDPTSDVIFDSVAIEMTPTGSKETAPHTDEEWAVVRYNALMLAEAGNLLKIPGRHVAPAQQVPGTENEPAGPEILTPAQIQALVNTDKKAFNKFAQGLTDAALIALRAVDARSVDGLFDAGDAIDTACENCHLKDRYPPGVKPAQATIPRKKN